MNDVMNKKFKRLICSICLASTFLSTYDNIYAETLPPENGIGTINFEENREIAEGVLLKSFNSISPTTNIQKGHTIIFNPKTDDINVLMSYGSNVYSKKPLTSMVKAAEAEGYTVIGGVNGDFFQIDCGVPVGLTVQNGRLIGANGQGWFAEGAKKEYWNAVGFKKDGSSVMGNPDITLGYTVNGSSEVQNILQFNKKRNELGVFLYSSDYSENTQTDLNSLDIVLNIEEGDIKLGQTIKCRVERITEEVKYTPLEKGKLLLSAEVYTPGFWQLKNLKLDDEVNILMTDKSGHWNDVVQATGGYKLLLKDGEVQEDLDTKTPYPTTAVGIKENGEVVILQIDGRQNEWSNGIPHKDTANYLRSIGCIDALMLDGGGSSTMAAKLPEEGTAKIINKPSDGRERSVGNGLLLLANAKRDNNFARLYAYQDKIKVSKGETITLPITATDASYYPVPVPSNLTSDVNPKFGTLSSSGVFTAGNISGTKKIKISSGKASTTIEVEVLPSFDEVAKKVESALLTKTFYDFNMALFETNKVKDEYEKAVLLSKLATIENIVWSDEIKQIYRRLSELAVTGSAKIYDEVLYQVNNSKVSTVDKNYLLSELTLWGRDLVWTDDYKTAMKYYMEFYSNKDKNSAAEAEVYILKIRNRYSREYLQEELRKLKEGYVI
jgi:exopolysaccharide biosynthesis protein